MIRLVHLSDIHLNSSTIKDAETFIFKALERDLVQYNKLKPIDMIMISGDLIDRGGDSFDDDPQVAFMTFEEIFIDRISSAIDLSKNRIFFSPGNHDIRKNDDNDIVECGLVEKLVDTTAVNQFMDSKDHVGLNRVSAFKDYEYNYYEKFDGECALTKFQSNFKFQHKNCSIGVSCLNSAWRCYDSKTDKNKIILGERQITESRNLVENCDIKIAIMHHPIEWLSKFDQREIKSLMSRDYQVLLCGHVHEGESWSKTDLYGSIFISVAPSNWTYNLRSNNRNLGIGYSIIDIDLANLKIINHFRRYSKGKEKFDPDTDLGKENGIFEYAIPATDRIRKIVNEVEVAQTIESLHFEGINEHLLTFNTDTKAPKEINDLFVMPRIAERIKYEIEKGEDDKGEENFYSLNEICSMDENLLIFGTKESGKTIMLDKILIEITSKIEEYEKIPVLFDFEDLSNKRFETIISRFLKIGILNIPKYLEMHSIVLLIDNLDFNKSNKHNLFRLEKFLSDNKNIQVIATSFQVYEGDIPIEGLLYPAFSIFTYATIKSFNIKEIKKLVKNWFSKNDNYNNPSKVDKLLNVLLTLNLPRSPLAISMFLWILEQHENYKPINHATMLENFIERMFKKLSKNEIYSDVFDYKNKERLLTEIAFYMLNKNLDNYKISFSELIDFVNDYLKSKRFDDFSTEEILKHFFEKSILVKDYDGTETFVRYRFTCFFQYFLTKKMSFDNSFKEFVLREDQYLKFNSEIDYYTGLKRDDSEILTLLINRMNEAYKSIIKDIDSFEFGFDQMFIVDKSLVDNVDGRKFLENITNGKPSEKEIDKVKDEALEGIKPEKGIKKKEDEVKGTKRLDRLWALSAQVLKNTEETNIEDLKDNAYSDIIKCSMAFASVHKYKLDEFFANKETQSHKNDFIEQLKVQHKAMPFIHQIALRYLMGTRKLSSVIRDKIQNDLENESISDFEKFISIFLYADLKGSDYLDYIKVFIKQIKHKYMNDMTLYKLIGFYYFRSNSRNSDKIFQNLIADLIIKSKKQKKISKGKIINKFIEMKNKKLKDGDSPIVL